VRDVPLPEEQLDQLWSRLESAPDRASDPFHTPVLGTVQAVDGLCGLRTVVLRRAERALRRLVCHTDARSSKVADLAASPQASWLFYDRAARLQVRVSGTVQLHIDDELADVQWHASRLSSRRCYLARPGPGATLDGPALTLPAELVDRAPLEEEAAAGRDHFAVLACTVDAIDCLILQYQGHRRLHFAWDGECWQARWLAP